jgi:hypothetical protein
VLRSRSLLCLLLAVPLAAQEPPKVEYGLMVEVGTSTGNQIKQELGNSVYVSPGLMLQWNLPGSHALRWRLEGGNGAKYDDKNRYTASYRESREITSWGGGLDYLYYVQGSSKLGLFFIGGFEYRRWNEKYKGTDSLSHFSESRSFTKNSVGSDLGVGYQFSPHFGADLRVFSTAFDRMEPQVSGNSVTGWKNTSVTGSQVVLSAGYKW